MLYTLTIAQILFAISIFVTTSPILVAIVGVVLTSLFSPVEDVDIDRALTPALVGEYSDCVALSLDTVSEDVKRQVRRTLHKSKQLSPIGAWFTLHSNSTVWAPRTPHTPPTTRRQRAQQRIQKRRLHLTQQRARKACAMNRATVWIQEQTGLHIYRDQAHHMLPQVSSGRHVMYKPQTT